MSMFARGFAASVAVALLGCSVMDDDNSEHAEPAPSSGSADQVVAHDAETLAGTDFTLDGASAAPLAPVGQSEAQNNSSSATADAWKEESFVGKHLVYAMKFAQVGPAGRVEFMRLGHMSFHEGGKADVWYLLYKPSATAASEPIRLSHNHAPMTSARDKANGCYAKEGGPVLAPRHAQVIDKPGVATWNFDGTRLRIRIGVTEHRWLLQKRPLPHREEDRFLTEGIFHAETGAPYFEETVGFAYVSDTVQGGDLSIATLKSGFRGKNINSYASQNWHKNDGFLSSKWRLMNNGLATYNLKPSPFDPKVVASSVGGSDAAYKRHSQTSLVLNDGPGSRAVFFSDGGHDYNDNGCMDEYGHSEAYFAARRNGGIVGIVRIEQSTQHNHKVKTPEGNPTHYYPLLSVGHAYRMDPTDLGLTITASHEGTVLKGFNEVHVVKPKGTLTLEWKSTGTATGDEHVGTIELWQGPVFKKYVTPYRWPLNGKIEVSLADHQLEPGKQYKLVLSLARETSPFGEDYRTINSFRSIWFKTP